MWIHSETRTLHDKNIQAVVDNILDIHKDLMKKNNMISKNVWGY